MEERRGVTKMGKRAERIYMKGKMICARKRGIEREKENMGRRRREEWRRRKDLFGKGEGRRERGKRRGRGRREMRKEGGRARREGNDQGKKEEGRTIDAGGKGEERRRVRGKERKGG
jgi:hypothetical protein